MGGGQKKTTTTTTTTKISQFHIEPELQRTVGALWVSASRMREDVLVWVNDEAGVGQNEEGMRIGGRGWGGVEVVER